MIQAFSFIRWSRPEQGKGDTLRRQKKASANLCERHGWNLTELPPLQGRSAFRGKQRAVGPLAEFLKLAEDGRVPKGSVLIVESLDRLTREAVRTAVKFFLSILDAGIDIATTNPEHIFKHDAENDIQDIMIAVVVLSRGHEESAVKSERVGEAWAKKRERAKTEKLTATCPAWLRLREDRSGFEVIDKNADTVRLIFRLAADGYGVFRITRKLNADKVPTLGSKKKKARQWYESYVIRILNNRAVLGEYQPCTRNGNKSVPQGEPIKDYYPPILKEADFVAARRAIDSRALGFKRTGKDIPNVFGKLIRNARDGSGWLYVPAKKKSPIARLEPVGGRNGTSAPLSMRYQVLEDAFLVFLSEVSVQDLTGTPKVSKAAEIEWKIKDLTKRIGVLEARLDTDDDLSSLLDKLKGWKLEKAELERKLEAENNPTDEGAILHDAKAVIAKLKENPEHYRTKLKQLLHLLIEEAWLLVYEARAIGSRQREMTVRYAKLQVHFKTGVVRSIQIYPEAVVGADAEGEPATFFDLRTLREDKDMMKTFSKPIPLPSAADAIPAPPQYRPKKR
ncbi:site-specific recombinase : Site-specific recombinase OS=Rhizobium sp. Pop5 GN=RCCGEPOP_06266 PE=4 SV=1: Resolvase: Recombinase [Gemmataceae bacterium]|nr:site-specific recombinase : Site-specific recombinase OS=Rhizobium sp. Pop5 GN=RCCGEPOP_06266 PE=4 SV=1: Resolvase: Recombinase [Gemmataceae bacterium]VTU02415.1 site-specific recombinase : Site-specific recombinase OS=Rhizobium sp. Pop5 GN=RCCGEPOP_06266 PE=4 SV=1: Resolvase: Recombinase [Gemmataceae bacterium]